MLSEPAQPVLRIALQSEAFAVRRALQGLFSDSRLQPLRDEQRGTAEMVLAEVLNNVVEHAYAGGSGEIEVSVAVQAGSLVFTVADRGAELPRHALPAGQLRDYALCRELPEGGFGWYLIRALAKDLDYRRQDNRNELSFRIELA